MYTVFAPNSFPMKINPIIRRNVFKINVNTETCIPNNFDNTRARPETLKFFDYLLLFLTYGS